MRRMALDVLFSSTCALPLLGVVRIVERSGCLERLELSAKDGTASLSRIEHVEEKETFLLREAYRQLREYLAGNRQEFALPLALQGTAFQRRVWDELQRIPYGQTRSYGQIATAVGCPGGARAVGMANNRNPVAVIVPCHRVIGADGSLVGYGHGLPVKAALLRLEGNSR